MSGFKYSALWRYGVAILTTGVATVVTISLSSFLKHGVMAFFVASVMISAWYGGLGPGLVASVLSVLASQYFFFPPIYSFVVNSPEDIAQIVVFFIVTVIISSLTHAQRRTLRALVKNEEEMKALNEALEARVKERTAWLTLLHDITRAANEAETVGQAFKFAAQRICKEGLWRGCSVYVPPRAGSDTLALSPYSHVVEGEDPAILSQGTDGLARRVLDRGQVELLTRGNSHSALAFPVAAGGEVVAVFECVSKKGIENSDNLVRLMSAIGLELGQVVGRKRLQEEYAEAVWQQQQRIAHELHDTLGQELTGLGFLSRSLLQSMQGTPGVATAERMKTGVERALEQIRGLAKGVMPVEREAEGLMSALQQLASTVKSVYGIPCRFECPRPVLIADHQIASQLYRIAQEAVTNAMKHARPGGVTLSLAAEDGSLLLSVLDDGVGIPLLRDRLREGSGLRIMRYRAAALGATLRIERHSPAGTLVSCRLPLANGGALET
jgi:signal transduction histidine kinase